MSSDQVLESFGRLLAKLAAIPCNKEQCRVISRIYRPLIISENATKKSTASSKIESIIKPLYTTYREDILLKDFSFLSDNKLIIDDTDISSLYINAIDSDDDDSLKYINNELLYLFYQVATSDDQKTIDTKYRKKPTPQSSEIPNMKNMQPNMASKLENLLNKNKTKLKRAETDPSAIPEVLSDLFKNNSDEMAGMLNGLLGTIGINPSNVKEK
jgi:hypothetical protein